MYIYIINEYVCPSQGGAYIREGHLKEGHIYSVRGYHYVFVHNLKQNMISAHLPCRPRCVRRLGGRSGRSAPFVALLADAPARGTDRVRRAYLYT